MTFPSFTLLNIYKLTLPFCANSLVAMKEDTKCTVSLLVALIRASLWFSVIFFTYLVCLLNATRHSELQNNQMFYGFESLD